MERETVERLRIALGITSRYLRSTEAGEGLTPTELSILATITRRGSLRLTELAEIERVNPTMLSRIAGRLAEARLISREADADDRRAARVEATAGGHRAARAHPRASARASLAAHLDELPDDDAARAARRAAGARGAGRGPAPRRAGPVRRFPHVSPAAIGRRTFAALANPNYRRWYAGQGISLDRHLDADDRPGLARLHADRIGHAARPRGRAADGARADPRALCRRDRRPRGQAAPDHRACRP